LADPVVLEVRAPYPKAALFAPFVLAVSAKAPDAVLKIPTVLEYKALNPEAVLLMGPEPVLLGGARENRAPVPIAVLNLESLSTTSGGCCAIAPNVITSALATSEESLMDCAIFSSFNTVEPERSLTLGRGLAAMIRSHASARRSSG